MVFGIILLVIAVIFAVITFNGITIFKNINPIECVMTGIPLVIGVLLICLYAKAVKTYNNILKKAAEQGPVTNRIK